MAVFGIGTILGPICGPVLGGWLTYDYNWRWVFFINLPVGIIATLGMMFFGRDSRHAHREPFDLLGFVTLSFAIGALQMTLDRGELKVVRIHRNLGRGDDIRRRPLSFRRPHRDRDPRSFLNRDF